MKHTSVELASVISGSFRSKFKELVEIKLAKQEAELRELQEVQKKSEAEVAELR